MKTYILTLDESQEDVIKALAKALKIDIQSISEADEDNALWLAMEEGKKYGITAFELHATKDGERVYIQEGFVHHNEPTLRRWVTSNS